MFATNRPDRQKMQAKAFGGRALPGPAGGAYSPPACTLAGLRGKGEEGRAEK